jgi:hypothetical protein
MDEWPSRAAAGYPQTSYTPEKLLSSIQRYYPRIRARPMQTAHYLAILGCLLLPASAAAQNSYNWWDACKPAPSQLQLDLRAPAQQPLNQPPRSQMLSCQTQRL